MTAPSSEHQRVIEWLMSGDTGVSSETICAVMCGVRIHSCFGTDVPHDPSDFGRCYRLLKKFPEWRARLPEVSKKHRAWKRLVEHWDELTALYERELKHPDGRAPELYERMKELRKP